MIAVLNLCVALRSHEKALQLLASAWLYLNRLLSSQFYSTFQLQKLHFQSKVINTHRNAKKTFRMSALLLK